MKLCVVATHPIQYQVPLFRMLNAEPDVEVVALFLSDHSVRGGNDPGFGQAVKWDVPMLEGYEYRFLENEGAGLKGSRFRSYRYSGFREIFQEIKPDALLVPGHSPMVYLQAVWNAKKMKIPVIVRYESFIASNPSRTWLKKKIRHAVLKTIYSRFDLFCSTGWFATEEGKSFGFKESDIIFSPHCIDTELFEKHVVDFHPRRAEIRKELGMSDGDVGIVFMGKMIDWKNPLLILDAIETMNPEMKKRMFPILVGSGSDLEKVRDRCVEVVGEGRFCCPGFVNQSGLCRYYVAGDVFVLPSKRGHESWGLVVNEAMTCGLPVIVSDGVGSRIDLVEGQGTGRMFEDGDAEGLATSIISFLNLPLKDSEDMKHAICATIAKYHERNAVKGILQGLKKVTDDI